MNNKQKIIDEELIKLLQGGNAHNDLTHALKGLPIDARGIKPDKLPYSIWQLLEHICIAQWDMCNSV